MAGTSSTSPTAVAAASSPWAAVPDEELIRQLVCGMLSQDPRQLRATVARHYTPGVVLYHYLTTASSALDLYRIYRSYTFGFRSRPVIRDIIIDTRPRKPHLPCHEHCGIGGGAAVATAAAAPPEGCMSAAVWLDQHVQPKGWPLPLPEAVIPTIVLLKFRPCPETGRPLVYEQYDHVSLYGFVWSFGAPTLWLFERVLKPAVLYGMGAVAYGLDYMEESWRFVKQQVLNIPPEGGDNAGDKVGGKVGGKAGGGVESYGAGGGSGAACDERRCGGTKELPGEVDHGATGYGLAGKQLDGSTLMSTPA